jgi:hypothetical protein
MSFMTERPGGSGDAPPGGTGDDRSGARHRDPSRPRELRPTARSVRRAVAGIGVFGAAVGLFACYLRLAATFPVGSDGASNALEAWDLLHGNWLLRGWTFTDVSFYTTELPEYAVVELDRGLNAGVVHTSAAITYTLLVLAAAALARGRARGAEDGATRPAAANPEQVLAGWLADHHLTTGLGTYTEGNVTTLDSGGVVRLRTVSWPRSGRAVPRLYQSSAAWYDPRTAYANFVVTGTVDRAGDLIPRAEILALAGPPAHTYRFDSFTIVVWNENLLARLAAPPSRLPGDIGHALCAAPTRLSDAPLEPATRRTGGRTRRRRLCRAAWGGRGASLGRGGPCRWQQRWRRRRRGGGGRA